MAARKKRGPTKRKRSKKKATKRKATKKKVQVVVREPMGWTHGEGAEVDYVVLLDSRADRKVHVHLCGGEGELKDVIIRAFRSFVSLTDVIDYCVNGIFDEDVYLDAFWCGVHVFEKRLDPWHGLCGIPDEELPTNPIEVVERARDLLDTDSSEIDTFTVSREDLETLVNLANVGDR